MFTLELEEWDQQKDKYNDDDNDNENDNDNDNYNDSDESTSKSRQRDKDKQNDNVQFEGLCKWRNKTCENVNIFENLKSWKSWWLHKNREWHYKFSIFGNCSFSSVYSEVKSLPSGQVSPKKAWPQPLVFSFLLLAHCQISVKVGQKLK